MTKVMLKLIIATVLVLPSFVHAATYWVSPTGEATWANAQSETPLSGAACTTVALAFANAAAGDTVYFRGGTYNIPAKNTGSTYSGYYNPSNSGSSGNVITFSAYTGETPVMNGTAGGTGDTSRFATIFGTTDKDYITFDGFTFQSDDGAKMARVFIGEDGPSLPGPFNVSNITIKNCTFNGGSVITSTDNNEGLRIESVGTVLVESCTFYNYLETNDYHNTSCIKTYAVSDLTISKCEIYDSSAGIYLKSGTGATTIQHCYVHDCVEGIIVRTDDFRHENTTVHNNIIANCSKDNLAVWADADRQDEGIPNWTVTNNTFYNSSAPYYGVMQFKDDVDDRATSWIVRNNLIQSRAGLNDYRAGLSLTKIYCETGGFDYNAFGEYPDASTAYTHYTTLAAIKAATLGGLTEGNHNINSVDGAIVFVNTSGTMSVVSDFALASNSPGYQAGSDGKDMGADVTLVGTGAEGGEDPPAPSGTATIRASGTAGWR